MRARVFLIFIFALSLSAAWPRNFRAQQQQQQGAAQKPPVDLGGFIKEVMVFKMEEGRSQLVIWLPYDFFAAASMAQSGKTAAAIDEEIGFLKPYITMAVQNSTERPDGGSTYLNESEVRARAVLKLADGSEIRPLTVVPPKVSATLGTLKTLVSAEGDAGSANIHILVFPKDTTRGTPIVDTMKKDALTLVLKSDGKFKETIFNWRTPFDAATKVPDCTRAKRQCPPNGRTAHTTGRSSPDAKQARLNRPSTCSEERPAVEFTQRRVFLRQDDVCEVFSSLFFQVRLGGHLRELPDFAPLDAPVGVAARELVNH